MRKLWLLLFILVFAATASFGQVVFGSPTTSTTISLTVTPNGSGTGSISSLDGKISNCHVGGGTCTGTYNIGSAVTLTPTTTSGIFNWSTGTGSAAVCSGSGTCNFTITVNSTVIALWSTSSSNLINANPVFGIDYNQTVSGCSGSGITGSFPSTIQHGIARFWDTPSATWPFIETANDVFNWATLDNQLCAMAGSSVKTAHFALARTPNFATVGLQHTDAGQCSYVAYSSTAKVTALSESGNTVTATSILNPGVGSTVVLSGDNPAGYDGQFVVLTSSGTQFTYTDSTTGLGAGTSFGTGCPTGTGCAGVPSNNTNSAAGQCDPPTDLNNDGTGANQYWRDWVAAIVAHTHQPGYIAGTAPFTFPHADLQYYEIWNEPDTGAFLSSKYGTFDQLIRMTQDAYCIISHSTGTVSYTGESCATVRGTVTHGAGSTVVDTTKFPSFPASPLDTSAQITTPSYHTQGNLAGKMGCYLYCGNPTSSPIGCSGSGNSWNSIGATAQSCHPPGAAAFVDVINEHMKAGNQYPASMESTMQTWTTNTTGLLSAGELAKPKWNSENAYSACGFPNWNTGGTCSDSSSPFWDMTMQAAYTADLYALSFGLGWQEDIWYDWNGGRGGLGPACATTGTTLQINSCANAAFNAMYNWLVGATMPNASSGTGCSNVGSVYTCGLTSPTGASQAIVWDNAQSCAPSGGSEVCTSSTQTVGVSFTTATDVFGDPPATVGACGGCAAHQIKVFIYPQLLK